MSKWTWQKWIGKLIPLAVSLLTGGIWEFFELPQPIWAGVIAGVLTMIGQAIISLFPPKPQT